MATTTILQMSEKKGIVGLTNIGNTCYGNATIQAIRHQVDFTIFLLQGTHKELLGRKSRSEKTRLLESYSDVVQKLWTSENGETVGTRDMWQQMIPAAVLAGVDHFRMPVAHDAHEFLVFLLDQFHEAMAEEVTMVVRTDPSKKQVRDALEFWKRSFEKSYSPLVELVFGLQRKSVCCEACKNESVSWETMNMVKVSVPSSSEKPLQLLDLMNGDADAETIDEYSCETCKPTRTKAKITHTLWRLGNWVIIVLKRFDNNGRRINTQVDIPLETSFGSLFHAGSQEPSKNETYSLFSSIHHHGSARGGHYTAHAKHPVSGSWAYYDDESGRECSSDPILDASTYIVMYRKKVE